MHILNSIVEMLGNQVNEIEFRVWIESKERWIWVSVYKCRNGSLSSDELVKEYVDYQRMCFVNPIKITQDTK